MIHEIDGFAYCSPSPTPERAAALKPGRWRLLGPQGCRMDGDEGDFNAAWESIKKGGITVGTPPSRGGGRARPWKWRDIAVPAEAPVQSPGGLAGATPFTCTSKSARTIPVSSCPKFHQRGNGFYGWDLVRRISFLAGRSWRPGEFVWTIGLALACASGRKLLGSHVFGAPLRVLYFNAEDSTNEIALRIRAE